VISRRGFLAGLAVLPVVGKLSVPVDELPIVSATPFCARTRRPIAYSVEYKLTDAEMQNITFERFNA